MGVGVCGLSVAATVHEFSLLSSFEGRIDMDQELLLLLSSVFVSGTGVDEITGKLSAD